MHVRFDLQEMSLYVDEIERVYKEMNEIHSEIDIILNHLKCNQLNDLAQSLRVNNEMLMDTMCSIKSDSSNIREVIELYRTAENLVSRNNELLDYDSIYIGVESSSIISDNLFTKEHKNNLLVEPWLKEMIEDENKWQ